MSGPAKARRVYSRTGRHSCNARFTSKQTPLDFLTTWFAAQCDGDWEHDLGIRIETLDNPGWSLDVRILETELQGVVAEWSQEERSADDWIHWRSTGEMYEARCGPNGLGQALAAFQTFARSAQA